MGGDSCISPYRLSNQESNVVSRHTHFFVAAVVVDIISTVQSRLLDRAGTPCTGTAPIG